MFRNMYNGQWVVGSALFWGYRRKLYYISMIYLDSSITFQWTFPVLVKCGRQYKPRQGQCCTYVVYWYVVYWWHTVAISATSHYLLTFVQNIGTYISI